MTARRVSLVSVLVRDYDEAIDFYTGKLGFTLVEDTQLGGNKRWVVVAPEREGSAALLLARAANADQEAVIGRQAGGRVFLFLETDDFARDHRAMLEKGVIFREEPRRETYGTVAVFEDLYGNPWDLVERR
jgi:catechol 2,3-dioxygenase-like lactoylglutathione lyase family enzyme